MIAIPIAMKKSPMRIFIERYDKKEEFLFRNLLFPREYERIIGKYLFL